MLLIFPVNTHRLFLWKKEGIIVTSAFQKLLKDSNDKPNKMWLDKSSQFYNRSMKSFLQNNNIEMHSTHNEGKSIVAERFIRTLKNKIYKCTTSILKNVDIDKLDQIVDKQIDYKLIKVKSADVNPSMYIDFNKENDKGSLKFRVGNHVRISWCKNIFPKGYIPNCSK